jgi:IPT/TIG domain
MTLKTAAGVAIAEGSFPSTAGTGGHAQDAFHIINEDVYEEFQQPGESGFTGKRLKWAAGQRVQLREITAAYPEATVTAISPATGAAAGGTTVTLTGTNLRGTTGVTFGGTAATSVTVVNDTTVTCVTPAKDAGAVTVILTDDGGTVTKSNFYTYT